MDKVLKDIQAGRGLPGLEYDKSQGRRKKECWLISLIKSIVAFFAPPARKEAAQRKSPFMQTPNNPTEKSRTVGRGLRTGWYSRKKLDETSKKPEDFRIVMARHCSFKPYGVLPVRGYVHRSGLRTGLYSRKILDETSKKPKDFGVVTAMHSSNKPSAVRAVRGYAHRNGAKPSRKIGRSYHSGRTYR